ncbi:Alpha-1-Antitrypsin-Related Protein-Like [Manis pentadactyla]|nr:Alpha-1-Antitrypsin-Related Protein-Like [Manis pentadactyla]
MLSRATLPGNPRSFGECQEPQMTPDTSWGAAAPSGVCCCLEPSCLVSMEASPPRISTDGSLLKWPK